jgi:hypothetical protein
VPALDDRWNTVGMTTDRECLERNPGVSVDKKLMTNCLSYGKAKTIIKSNASFALDQIQYIYFS